MPNGQLDDLNNRALQKSLRPLRRLSLKVGEGFSPASSTKLTTRFKSVSLWLKVVSIILSVYLFLFSLYLVYQILMWLF